MRRSITDASNILSAARTFALVVFAGLALAGCETTGSGSAPAAQAAAPPEPMTHSRAAMECWMAAEKSQKTASLDKRADYVTKCIDDKMKGAPATPKG